MGAAVAGVEQFAPIGAVRLAEQPLEDALPVLHEQLEQHRNVLQAGVGRQALLPVAADALAELAAEVGQQTIPQLIESLADAVAVGEGHGRGSAGAGLEGVDQGEAGDGLAIAAVAGDQGEIQRQRGGVDDRVDSFDL